MQICERPFTVFKWKAGTQGRFKKTEVCQTCAKMKNVCQTCLFDLQYGLPVEVRDKFLGKEKVAVPTQEGNRNYWAQLATTNVTLIQYNNFSYFAQIDNLALPYEQKENPILKKLARTQPYYERNKAHVCSFWLKGTCTRGKLCPYRHEKGPEKGGKDIVQSIRDRFHGTNDPVARKIMGQVENSKYVRPPKDQSIRTLVIYFLEEKHGNRLR